MEHERQENQEHQEEEFRFSYHENLRRLDHPRL